MHWVANGDLLKERQEHVAGTLIAKQTEHKRNPCSLYIWGRGKQWDSSVPFPPAHQLQAITFTSLRGGGRHLDISSKNWDSYGGD